MDEKTLIQKLQNGEDAAFKTLYEQHYSVLCHYASTIIRDDFAAKSIVGDCIFKMWQNRLSLNIKTTLRAYLMASVRYRCFNYIRDSSRFDCTSRTSIEDTLEMMSDRDGNPLGKLLENEFESIVIQAVDSLPHKTKEVFELSRIDHKSYFEISEHLDISINTVKYHMKQALCMLSEMLSPYLKADPDIGKRH